MAVLVDFRVGRRALCRGGDIAGGSRAGGKMAWSGVCRTQDGPWWWLAGVLFA